MLKGQKVYLDLRDYPFLEKLESDIRCLGATVEKFLSRETTYVITSREKAVRQKTAPQRVCSPTQRLVPGDGEKICRSTFSRGQKLLMRSNSMNGSSMPTSTACDPVQFAATWNIPIVSIESLLKAIRSAVQPIAQSASVTGEKVGKTQKGEIRMRKLTGVFIKIEDVDSRYRPFYGELPLRPCINSCPVAGESIFNVHSKKQVPQSDAVKKTCRTPIAKKERGYCECCDVYYPDVKEHLREPNHRLFAQNRVNFDRLDALTSELSLLSSVAGSSCEFSHQAFIEEEIASDSKRIIPPEALMSLPEFRSVGEDSDSEIHVEYSPSVTSNLLSKDVLDASGSKRCRDLSSQVPELLSDDIVDVSGPSFNVEDLQSGTSGLPSSPGIIVAPQTEFVNKDLPIQELQTLGTSINLDLDEKSTVNVSKFVSERMVNGSWSQLTVSDTDFLPETPTNVLTVKTSQDFNQDLSSKDPDELADSKSVVVASQNENQVLITDLLANSVISKELMNDKATTKILELLSENSTVGPSLKCADKDFSSGDLKLPHEHFKNYSESIEINHSLSCRPSTTLFESISPGSVSKDVVITSPSVTHEFVSENMVNFMGSKNEDLACEKTESICDIVMVTTVVEPSSRDVLTPIKSHLDSINSKPPSEKSVVSTDFATELSCQTSGVLLESKVVVASCSIDKNVSSDTAELLPIDTMISVTFDQHLPSCASEIQLKSVADAVCSKAAADCFPVEVQDLKSLFGSVSGAPVSNALEYSPSVTLALHCPPTQNSSISKHESESISGTIGKSQHDDLDNGIVNNNPFGWVQTEACPSVESRVLSRNCDDVVMKPTLEQVMTEEAMDIQNEVLEVESSCRSHIEPAAETTDQSVDAMIIDSIANGSTSIFQTQQTPRTQQNVEESVVHEIEDETVSSWCTKVESAAETGDVSSNTMVMESGLRSCLPLNGVNAAIPEAMEFIIEPVGYEVENMVDSRILKGGSAFETEQVIANAILLEPECRNCSPLRDASVTIPQVMENLTEPVVCKVKQEPVYSCIVNKNSALEAEDFSSKVMVMETEHQNRSLIANNNFVIHHVMENVMEPIELKVREMVSCCSLEVESDPDTKGLSANAMVLKPEYRSCSPLTLTDINTVIPWVRESSVEVVVDEEVVVDSHNLKFASVSEIDNLCPDTTVAKSERENCSPSTLTDVNIEIPQLMVSSVEIVVEEEVEEVIGSRNMKFESASEIVNLCPDTVVTEYEHQNYSQSTLTDVNIEIPQVMESSEEIVVDEEVIGSRNMKFESAFEIDNLCPDTVVTESECQDSSQSTLTDVNIEIPQVMESSIELVVDEIEEMVDSQSVKPESAFEIDNLCPNTIVMESKHQNCLPLTYVITDMPDAPGSIMPVVDEGEEFVDCHSVSNNLGVDAMVMEYENQNCSPLTDVSIAIPQVMESSMEHVDELVNTRSLKLKLDSKVEKLDADAKVMEPERRHCLPLTDVNTGAGEDDRNEHDHLIVEAVHLNFTNDFPAVEPITADVQVSCPIDILPTSSLPLSVFPSFEMCSSEGSQGCEDSDLISSHRVDDILAFLSGSHSDSLCDSSDHTMPLSPGYLPTADAGGVEIQAAQSLSALDLFGTVLEKQTGSSRLLAKLSDHSCTTIVGGVVCKKQQFFHHAVNDSPCGIFETFGDDGQLICRTSDKATLVLDDSGCSNVQNQPATADLSRVPGVIEMCYTRLGEQECEIADSSVETRTYVDSLYLKPNFNDGDGDHYLSLSDISSAVESEGSEPVVKNDCIQMCQQFAIDCSTTCKTDDQTEIECFADRESTSSRAISSAMVSDFPYELNEQINKCTVLPSVRHFHAKKQEDLPEMSPVERFLAVVNNNDSSCIVSDVDGAKYSARSRIGQQEYLSNVPMAMEDAERFDGGHKSSIVCSEKVREQNTEGLTSLVHGLEVETARIVDSHFDDHQQFAISSISTTETLPKPVTGVSKNGPEVLSVGSAGFEELPIDVCTINSDADVAGKEWSRDPVLSALEASELSDKTDIYSPSVSFRGAEDEEAEGLFSELAIDGAVELQDVLVRSFADTCEVERMDYGNGTFQPACQTTSYVVKPTTEPVNPTCTGRTQFLEAPHVDLTSYCRKMKKSDARSQFRNVSASPYKSIANHASDVVRELELLERLAAGLVSDRTSTATSNRPLNIGVHDALLSLAGEMELDRTNRIASYDGLELASDSFDDRTQLESDSTIDDDFFSKLLQDCDNIPDLPSDPFSFLLHSPRTSSVEKIVGTADTRISAVCSSAESVSKSMHTSTSLRCSKVMDFLPKSGTGDSCKQGLHNSASTVPSIESKICSRTTDSGVWQVQAIVGLRMRLKKVMEKSVLAVGSGNISRMGCSDWQARRRSSTGLKLVITLPRAPSTDQMRIC